MSRGGSEPIVGSALGGLLSLCLGLCWLLGVCIGVVVRWWQRRRTVTTVVEDAAEVSVENAAWQRLAADGINRLFGGGIRANLEYVRSLPLSTADFANDTDYATAVLRHAMQTKGQRA